VSPGNIEAVSPSAHNEEEVFSDEDDDEMPEIRIYNKSSEDVITNPTLRIHNAHPQSQILGDPNTPVQTRSSLKKITEAHALVTPKTSHLNAVKRIFKYLKGKPNLGLWYPRESPLDLEAFSDSDYGGSNLDRKSTTGGCQFLGQRLISWKCKKQTIVATSTTEAEYVAAANCCGQVLEEKSS
ncbi:hypothetical protein Tco_0197711, partial [Tanacetum coccineum]